MDTTNYYEQLELNPNSSIDEIKEQLKKAKRLWNNRKNAPTMDARQEAERKVELIQLAEKVFVDANAKAQYDKTLAPKTNNNVNQNNNQQNFNQNNNQQNFNQNNNQQNFNQNNNQQNFNQNGKQTTEQMRNALQGMMNTNQYEKAIQMGNSILEIEPNNEIILAKLAICYNNVGKAQNNDNYKNTAIKLSERAVSLNPTILNLVNTSLYCRQAGVPNRAEPFLARAEKLDPNATNVRRERVYLANANRDFDQSIKYATLLVDENPQDENFKSLLADAYVDKAYSECIYVPADKLYYIVNETALNAVISYSNKALQVYPNFERATNSLEWAKRQSKKVLNKDALWLLVVPFALLSASWSGIDQIFSLILGFIIVAKCYQPKWYATRVYHGYSKLWIDITFGAKNTVGKVIAGIIVYAIVTSISNVLQSISALLFMVFPLALCFLISKYQKNQSI